MNLRKALITGITGQDGSYLAELLLARGYEVHGVVRPGRSDTSLSRISHLLDRISLHEVTFDDHRTVFDVVERVQPQECYHLAAQTFVSYAPEDEARTLNTNVNGTLVLLSAIRAVAPECRFCLAGSSEVFGRTGEAPQNENTRFHPRNVYGISKMAAFELVRTFRETYGLFAGTAILFNHESPRRGPNFVTRKVTRGVAAILAGQSTELTLGNLDSRRDWGHARDYVRAMWLMTTQEHADDYVIATGTTHTVREFVDLAFSLCGLRADDYVRTDPALFRPAEGNLLCGDASRAAAVLGWQPEIPFEEIVREMVEADCRAFGVGPGAGAAASLAQAHMNLE